MPEANGRPRTSCHPTAGHLYSLHVASALGLGGTEANPRSFQPIGGFTDHMTVTEGHLRPPPTPAIGWERRRELHKLFATLNS